MIYFWVALSYLLILIVVGAVRSRNVKNQADFMVAGRKLPTYVLVGTLLATWIGSGSIFGNAEKTYEIGIVALILPIAGFLGIIVLYFIAGRVRNFKQFTVQDILEVRYNKWARVFGTITVVTAYTTIVSYQYRAGGAVINIINPDIDVSTGVIISAVFVIIYTAMAGMLSVAYTDLVNGVLIIIGIFLAVPFLFVEAGGIEGMRQVLPDSHFNFRGILSWWEIVGLLLPPFLLMLGDANMYQRFFSAKDAATAKKSVIYMLIGVAVVEVMIILTAWMASALNPGLETPGRVIVFAAFNNLPVLLGVIIISTVIAIIVSTADSYLLVPATSLVRDIYQRFIEPDISPKKIVLLSRIVVIVLGIIAYLLSTLDDKFLSVALYAYTIYGAGITPALLASFFWKRATTQGGVSSILVGTFVTIIWKNFGMGSSVPASMGLSGVEIDAVIPAIFLSVFTLIVVSLLTEPPDEEKWLPFMTK